MRAWWVDRPGPLTGPQAGRPLVYGERPDPVPGPGDGEPFQEHRLLSVTANTRRVLTNLAADRVSGAAVLQAAASPADAR